MVSRRHLFFAAPALAARPSLKLAKFSVDVTPPKGSPLCYSLVVPAERVELPLMAKGIVLYPDRQQPIVLCAVDWLGIGGDSHLNWRTQLAKAARTTPDRVTVQTVHQHDAPGDYSDAAALVPKDWLTPNDFCRTALDRVAAAVLSAKPVSISHWSASQATVEKVASNRRILSPDGKSFVFQRFTACRNSPHCDAPEGVIDSQLKTLSFYSNNQSIANLHYYATHPMSYYGKGVVNPDFVGIARESVPGFNVYFTGAAGNIGAGKYNDGDPGNRAVLAERIASAMKTSLASAKPVPVSRLQWKALPIYLPHRQGADFTEAAIRKVLENPAASQRDRATNARYLAWWRRCQTRSANITVQAFKLDGASVLHMPGELFVEYQLAAIRENRSNWTAMAAYGDYAPMYIGTAEAYPQQGYETSAVSRVGPDSESILLKAIQASLA